MSYPGGPPPPYSSGPPPAPGPYPGQQPYPGQAIQYVQQAPPVQYVQQQAPAVQYVQAPPGVQYIQQQGPQVQYNQQGLPVQYAQPVQYVQQQGITRTPSLSLYNQYPFSFSLSLPNVTVTVTVTGNNNIGYPGGPIPGRPIMQQPGPPIIVQQQVAPVPGMLCHSFSHINYFYLTSYSHVIPSCSPSMPSCTT